MNEDDKALVERLWIQAGIHYASKSIGILTKQQSMNAMNCAADRIEQLTAEVERLREALTDIGVYGCGMLNQPTAMNGPEEAWLRLRIREMENVARAALEGKQ